MCLAAASKRSFVVQTRRSRTHSVWMVTAIIKFFLRKVTTSKLDGPVPIWMSLSFLFVSVTHFLNDRTITGRKNKARQKETIERNETVSHLSKASPRAMAQSSAVWWSSMWRSPLHISFKSKWPCLAIACSMWSRNPSPVST